MGCRDGPIHTESFAVGGAPACKLWCGADSGAPDANPRNRCPGGPETCSTLEDGYSDGPAPQGAYRCFPPGNLRGTEG